MTEPWAIVPDPSESNITAIESFDHSALKDLPEYHAVSKAMDALVRASNAKHANQPDGVGQALMLATVRQMATALSYADSSGHPDNGCADRYEGVWPYKTEAENGWLRGTYRCTTCGAEWDTGYSVNIGEFI
jgi:hypothetical protein